MTESQLQQEIRIALGREPDLVLWRNSVGVAQTDGRAQRFGLCKGSSDLIGIGPGGLFFALEIKTKTGRIQPQQQLFVDLVNRRGGFAAVVRSVDEAWQALTAARRQHGGAAWTQQQQHSHPA